MESNKSHEQEEETSSAKVVLGIRVSPHLKEELNHEAEGCGMLTSEYGKLILESRHDSEKLEQKIKEQQKEIEVLKASLNNNGSQSSELVVAENAELRQQVTSLNNRLSIFNDKRLLYLFSQLKGKKDVVENVEGKNFDIVYQSPSDILIALIYASKLNQ